MKHFLEYNEWFPVFELSEEDNFGYYIELSDAEYNEVNRVFKEFKDWQDRFKEAAHNERK